MLLAEDTDREKAIAYLEELKAQVEVQQVEAARINKYQALFKVRGGGGGEERGGRGGAGRSIEAEVWPGLSRN